MACPFFSPFHLSTNSFTLTGSNCMASLLSLTTHNAPLTQLTEPVYRLAEQEWKDFIEKLIDVLTSVDPEIPPLPPKDVIHRIYRDVSVFVPWRGEVEMLILAGTVQQR
jgi:hypothetical protein